MSRIRRFSVALAVCLTIQATQSNAADPASPKSLFRERVAPIFERHCVRCHNDDDHKGGLSLTSSAMARKGGDSGALWKLDKTDESLLLQAVQGNPPEMPKNAAPLSAEQIGNLKDWINGGADWPADLSLKDKQFEGQTTWSLRPLFRPSVPSELSEGRTTIRSPLDAFIRAKLFEKQLHPSTEADRRTLIRRMSFDLHGLPPEPDDVDEFLIDSDPTAFERLMDRLLASPRYGERWARHWLDVVHYGDTHGYDKDKPRPNAWPYRDYVIRSLNQDKPYDRFVLEQLAGDILWPETIDGTVATGFIAAGPWDFIGHAEVPESKIDGKIARNLDRDDMVTTAMNTFCSMTVQCARCHNHKFDPVTQRDYYRMQAVFAALDRADRTFDADPAIGRRRTELLAEQSRIKADVDRLKAEVVRLGGDELKELDKKIASARQAVDGPRAPEYGYHSAIERRQDVTKWVQIDLGKPTTLKKLAYVGCWDDFNGIGAGFGFPVRFKIEVCGDPEFQSNVVSLVDRTQADAPNPGTTEQQAEFPAIECRYVRFTATKLALRQNDYIFALAELMAFDADGKNVSSGCLVSALDSIEAPVRWARKNLVDDIYSRQSGIDINQLQRERTALLERAVPSSVRDELQQREASATSLGQKLSALPAPQYVYAGMVYTGSGTFSGTGPSGGKPRSIHILRRGDVTALGEEVGPGFVPLAPDQTGEFALPADHPEGARRVAFARWITDDNQPLTWRSIANRVWQYHFGRGIVDSPNDFGRMGQLPTHPELLDWLACEIRGGDSRHRSLKHLHRLILSSSTYRQTANPQAGGNSDAIDSGNSLCWRANRRKLDAEALRDSMLFVAGKLDDRMGGPGFQDFVVEKPEHSPHYEYQLHDAEDVRSHRRSVYRFLVRSQTQPFMTTLDCADPSMIVEKRNETVTALQALALLNNKLVLAMSRHLAARVEASSPDNRQRIRMAFRVALSRDPLPEEQDVLTAYADEHGMVQTCRLILNLNEFAFLD